ncbi:hypothetical protein LX64_00333 [Chitinophaga skermanii]|uniref:Secreted protein n=1 Tax=Chitinophaga skermanii TaxID=331697 RepID=A0A327R9Y6_9BACT|nr:hypothetical protein [Chitinophaga skermanii]RAJ10727.1 hypothetical protein LX64_00333 [Chitinophaga skermanii]
MKHIATWLSALLVCVVLSSYAVKHTPVKTAKTTTTKKAVRTINVFVNEVGYNQLITARSSQIVANGNDFYQTVPGTGTGPVGPVEPWDPIICDGKTYSQLWADITNKWNAWRTSPSGIAAQNWANANCKPVFYCVENCMVAVMYVIEPTTTINCPQPWQQHLAVNMNLQVAVIE